MMEATASELLKSHRYAAASALQSDGDAAFSSIAGNRNRKDFKLFEFKDDEKDEKDVRRDF